MKKTLYNLTALVLIPVIYYIIITGFKTGNIEPSNNTVNSNITVPPGPGNGRDFMNCIFNTPPALNAPWWIQQNIGLYGTGTDALHFNTIHAYDMINGGTAHDEDGTNDYGKFTVDLEAGQKTNIDNLTDLVSGQGLNFLYERSKISKLCYAQRLIYEVKQPNTSNVNNGFCYSTTSGEWVTEADGTTAIHASQIHDNTARYIAHNIYENLQHGDLYNFNIQYADAELWYIKPRMRIPTGIPDETPIVKIEIVNYENNLIDTVLIKAANFKNNGSYSGQYIDEFFGLRTGALTILGGDGTSHTPPELNDGQLQDEWRNWKDNCKTDFRVWWCGNVDVWFDKMTVDDKYGDRLFKNEFDDEIEDEIDYYFSGSDRQYTFFADELTYSQFESVMYVKNKINEYCTTPPNNFPVPKLHIASSNYHHTRGHKDNSYVYELMYDILEPSSVNIDAHEFGGRAYLPHNIANSSNFGSGWIASNYDQYNNCIQQNVFGDRTTVTAEATNITNNNQAPWHGSLIYQIAKAVEQRNTYSPETKVIIQPQIQAIMYSASSNGGSWLVDGLREPTNEELEAQAMISIARGADGLCWFWYPSDIGAATTYQRRYPMLENQPIASNYFFQYGLLNPFKDNYTKRTNNLYGQNKWDKVKNFNKKITNWKSTLDAITWQSGYSVHSEGANYEYISDILSIDPHQPQGTQNPCVNDNQTGGYPYGPYLDCPDERYWEMGFFSTSEPNTKYFMMVNRRCVPANPNANPPYGDDRILKIRFDPNDFENYNSWNISEVGGTSNRVTFDKNSNIYVDLGSTNGGMGWFKPGEGKLFKIETVPVKGGTLVADENISGHTFTCEAPVYNNGYNITIGANTTIHFNDSSKFVMNGGVFTVGDQNTSAPQNITSDAVTGSSWSGHRFTNCEVKIYGATFTGLTNDTTYAVNIIDCPVVDIRNSIFNTNSSLKGGVNAVFFSDPNNEISLSNIYIGANTFNSSGSTIPTVNISSYAGETTPLIIENNTFNEGNTAIFLSGITGGAIKGNAIIDNYIGINALTSSIDIKSNTISSTVNNAIGIFAAGGSELKMNNAGSKTLGGLNDLSNSGTSANNIVVDGSVFLLDGGENIFNITDDQSSKHLYGYFPQFTQGPFDETNNCFKLNSSPVDPPYNMVTSGFQGSQITFNFTPYLSGCEPNEGGDGFAINLGDGIFDTIYNEGSGSGGSMKNALPLNKGEYSRELGREGVYYTIPTAKVKYDSISVLMRYRSYSQARTKCLDLINAYPDSIQSLNAVSKLFLSTVASDTSYNAVNELKTYYENLILNHSGNVSLVKRANYYILKCKVRMREYSQALAGFQQIINLNPYSYEGLIARWDYMATSLLIQGHGGSYSSIDNDQLTINNYDIDGNDDDSKPFTKEQRQDIRKSINTAIEVTKDEDDRKIKTLAVKSEQGDVNASKELSQMLTLKQVIKTDRPKSITEHVRIVSEDIRKVFGSNTSSKGNEPKNIPMVFRLSQNYPNPFNPVTKINYDLPKDSKVKIVIYDILGREVKRLVNSELKTAGSYIVDFNASNYASGVYFYRIEAEEPNGNKFVDSKKMVLIK